MPVVREDTEEKRQARRQLKTPMLAKPSLPTIATREEMRRYWRHDFTRYVLLLLPLGFAFDHGLRVCLQAGWVPANVWTLLVIRPALDYLAVRSIAKWLRIGGPGLYGMLGVAVAVDATSFGVPEALAIIGAACWTIGLILFEVLQECVFKKSIPASSSPTQS